MNKFLNELHVDLITHNNNFVLQKDKIIKLMHSLFKQIDALNTKQIELFIDDHISVLTSICFDFQLFINDEKDRSTKDKLIRLKDQIFRSKLKDMHLYDHRRTVTILLNDFLKGITWFQNENVYNERDPVYHRNGSCNMKGSQNFTCIGVTDRTTRKSNKKTILKCYIERLIYDELWSKINQNQQDEGHLKWLTNTKEAYQSCYPNHFIEITLKYNNEVNLSNQYTSSVLNILNNNIPTYVNIKIFKNYEVIDEIIYRKNYINSQYIYPVLGIRYKNNKVYYKNTHFLKDKLWLLRKTK